LSAAIFTASATLAAKNKAHSADLDCDSLNGDQRLADFRQPGVSDHYLVFPTNQKGKTMTRKILERKVLKADLDTVLKIAKAKAEAQNKKWKKEREAEEVIALQAAADLPTTPTMASAVVNPADERLNEITRMFVEHLCESAEASLEFHNYVSDTDGKTGGDTDEFAFKLSGMVAVELNKFMALIDVPAALCEFCDRVGGGAVNNSLLYC
jgi:hypothetical protein